MAIVRNSPSGRLINTGSGTQDLESVLTEGNDAGAIPIENLGAGTNPSDAARLDDIPPAVTPNIEEVLTEGDDANGFTIENLGGASSGALARSIDTFPFAGSGVNSNEQTSRGSPIYLPEGFVVRSFFTWFNAGGGTATNFQMALYDLAGTELGRSASELVAPRGLRRVAAQTPFIIANEGPYVIVMGFNGVASADIVTIETSGNSIFGSVDLGGTFPLPASITPTNQAMRYYMGVSELSP